MSGEVAVALAATEAVQVPADTEGTLQVPSVQIDPETEQTLKAWLQSQMVKPAGAVDWSTVRNFLGAVVGVLNFIFFELVSNVVLGAFGRLPKLVALPLAGVLLAGGALWMKRRIRRLVAEAEQDRLAAEAGVEVELVAPQ
jgi:hypothetical protein